MSPQPGIPNPSFQDRQTHFVLSYHTSQHSSLCNSPTSQTELLEIAQTMSLMPVPPSALLPSLDVSSQPRTFLSSLKFSQSCFFLICHLHFSCGIHHFWYYNLVTCGYAWCHLLGTKFSGKMRSVLDSSLHPSQNLKQGHSAKISWMNQPIYLHSDRKKTLSVLIS